MFFTALTPTYFCNLSVPNFFEPVSESFCFELQTRIQELESVVTSFKAIKTELYTQLQETEKKLRAAEAKNKSLEIKVRLLEQENKQVMRPQESRPSSHIFAFDELFVSKKKP